MSTRYIGIQEKGKVISWLKKARRLSHISAQELADRAGFTRDYIMKMEKGARPIPSTIYDALGYTPQIVKFETEKLLREINYPKADVKYIVAENRYLYITSAKEGTTIDASFLALLLENQINLYER